MHTYLLEGKWDKGKVAFGGSEFPPTSILPRKGGGDEGGDYSNPGGGTKDWKSFSSSWAKEMQL